METRFPVWDILDKETRFTTALEFGSAGDGFKEKDALAREGDDSAKIKFFQSFMGARQQLRSSPPLSFSPPPRVMLITALLCSARHPVLSTYVDLFVSMYEGAKGGDVSGYEDRLGVRLLGKAYSIHRSKATQFLEENRLPLDTYRDVPLQTDQATIGCNYIVGDHSSGKAFFYSHMVGTPMCCHPTDENSPCREAAREANKLERAKYPG